MVDALPEAPPKLICTDCLNICSQPLVAPHPFRDDEEIHGCPNCLDVETLGPACAAPGCSREATGGYPGGLGYRYAWTCWEHSPANPKNKDGADA